MVGSSVEEMVRQCTENVKVGLRPFVERELQQKYGNAWEMRAGCQSVAGTPHWDLQALLKTMIDNWQIVFDKSLPRSARNLVFELKDWRNHIAHEHKMNLEDVARMLDTAARLLKIIGAPQAAEIESLRIKILQAVIAGNIVAPSPPQFNPNPSKPVTQHTAALTSKLPDDIRHVHIAGAPPWQTCVGRLKTKMGMDLSRKAGRCVFSADGKYGVCCIVSKEYPGNRYWWNLRDRQLREVAKANHAFVAFACGTIDNIIALPLEQIQALVPTFNPKPGDDGNGWHIHILFDKGNWWLLQTGRDNRVDVTKYVI